MADADTLSAVLAQTIDNHMTAILPHPRGTNTVDRAAILANLAASYKHDFGHSYFVATRPPLQGEKDGPGFVAHMSGMAPALQTWDIRVTQRCVDAARRSAVVRADFYMTPRGGETVVNDIVFWMQMDESGEKLVRVTEFVDPVASAELGARMKAGMER